MQVRSARICHGWTPETGFLPYDWGGYNEAMILYLLALGSPTFPINAEAWTAWTGSYVWQTHYGQAFVVFPPLFGHQYSHVWIDFRGIQDTYMRDKGLDYLRTPAAPPWPTAPMRLPIPMVGLIMAKTCGA